MSEKKKIVAYFLGIYPKVSNTFIANEIKALRQMGNKIIIYSLNHSEEGDPDELEEVFYIKRSFSPAKAMVAHFYWIVRKPFVYLKYVREIITGKYDWRLFFRYLWLAKIVGKAQVDIIYTHFAEAQAYLARLVSQLLDIPYVFKSHTSDAIMPTKVDMKRLIYDAAQFLVVSEDFKEFLIKTYRIDQEKILVHPCGIDLVRFRFSGGSRATNHILFVGRQDKNKGIDDLLQSLASLKNEQVPFQCTIIGNGPSLGYFQHLANELRLNEDVQFLGAVPNEQIMKYYADSTMLVLPSAVEGAPVVIMEAMAMGLPVVSTRVGGIPEMITDGVNGFLITPKSVEELTAKIRILLNDSLLARKMGEAGKIKAVTYDLHHQTSKIQKIFLELQRDD